MKRTYMNHYFTFNAFGRHALHQFLLAIFCICFISCELDPDFDPGGVGGDVEAKFSITKQTEPNCYAPCTVTFENTSTGATQYTWNFGDGMTSNAASPSHEFDEGGDYVVTLTASNTSGDEHVGMMTVKVLTPITFKKTFGDANDQWGNMVIITEDGGYAIAGWENTGDGYLLVLDENGSAVFGYPKKYSSGVYEFSGIDQTDDGGFILTGRSSNFQPQLVLLRTDALGNVVANFPKTFTDPGQTPDLNGVSVSQLPDGGFGILGRSRNSRGGGGQNDIVYFRTNPSGEQVDFAYFNSDPFWSDESVGNWVFNGVDEFFAVGGSRPDDDFFLTEFFAVRFDIEGNVVNTPVIFGGAMEEELKSVCIDPQGGYAATGHTLSSGNGQSDVFFVKFNSSGSPIISSQKTFGGVSEDYGSAIQPTSDGGFVIIGYTTSFGLGISDFYLLKLDNNGILEYSAVTFGGFSGDSALDIKETSDRGFIIVGITESFGNGGTDIYVIKTDAKGRVL